MPMSLEPYLDTTQQFIVQDQAPLDSDRHQDWDFDDRGLDDHGLDDRGLDDHGHEGHDEGG